MVLTPVVVELEDYDKIEVLSLPMNIFAHFVLFAVSKALPFRPSHSFGFNVRRMTDYCKHVLKISVAFVCLFVLYLLLDKMGRIPSFLYTVLKRSTYNSRLTVWFGSCP